MSHHLSHNKPKNFTVVHLVTPYLFHTGSWIYSQIKGLKSFNNLVFSQRSENLEKFPYDKIFSSDDFLIFKKFINKVYRKLTDNYGLFFNKFVKKNNPVIFHAHMGHEGARWLSFIKRTNKCLITTFYGHDVSQLGRLGYWKNKYSKLFSYGTFFLAEGSYLKQQLIELGCPEEKIIVQHLGVDIQKYPKKSFESQNHIKIIQICSFREKKGIEYSLEALALLKKRFSDFTFTLIGGGEEFYTKKIDTLIISYGLEDNVFLPGIVSHQEMLLELKNSDIFLHPSITAKDGDNEGGAPVIIIEAAAIGLPVVSTFHADIPEVVIHNKSGLLADEGNSNQISEYLFELCGNFELRRRMGLSAMEHIRLHYNLDLQLKKLESIYFDTIKMRIVK